MRQATAAAVRSTTHLLLLSTSILGQTAASFSFSPEATRSATSIASVSKLGSHRHWLQLRRPISTTVPLNMGWSDTWDDILNGGSPRWKISCEESHQKALSHFQRFVGTKRGGDPSNTLSVFCPLAGDDPFVHLLWKQGYSVTSIDLVPEAVDAMRSQFEGGEGAWTKTEQNDGTIVWNHDSGRATLYVGDALHSRSELNNKFDAVYDKDSFGALQKEMRTGYCKRISEYCKKDATVYLEVKLKDNHDAVRDVGPPFSLQRQDLMEDNNYGSSFEYVEGLGSVYDLPMPSAKQTGHVLRRI